MSAKKIVVKTSINCQKCQTLVMKVVSKLEGIESMAIDRAKETITVIGEVDPVCIIKCLRKCGKFADIVSVGPKEEKKDVEKPKPAEPLIPCCKSCEIIGVFPIYDNSDMRCIIM